jgi:alkanesulfonate monooxygenase SsuD/methylene tetrahydromethanopterin reductase-like flavin-dependent oxidoreductase (luciferase family)
VHCCRGLSGYEARGIGGGWNAEEMADHGTAFATRFKLMRERTEAMKEIWARSKPKYTGELVKFDEMMQWPKPVQRPHPPVIVGGGFPQGARRAIAYGDGWMPIGGRGGDTLALLPPFREMLAAAGRDPAEVPVTLFGVSMDGDALKRARDAGVDRLVFGVPPDGQRDKMLEKDRLMVRSWFSFSAACWLCKADARSPELDEGPRCLKSMTRFFGGCLCPASFVNRNDSLA